MRIDEKFEDFTDSIRVSNLSSVSHRFRRKLGGFEQLVSADTIAAGPCRVLLGSQPEWCGWENLFCRLRVMPSRDLSPTGQGRCMTVAGYNNGAYHPGCFIDGMVGTLPEIQFLASEVRTLGSQFAPF